jgi:ComF family protein
MNLIKVLVDILYPARCPLCEKILPGPPGNKKYLACPACEDKLPLIVSPRCMKCGKQLSVMEQEYCQDCSRHTHIYDRGVAAVAYCDAMRLSVHRYKYESRREYTAFYARLMYDNCAELIRQWNIDVIVPVPLYPGKKRIRGYNQAELLANELGKLLQIPVNSDILLRRLHTRPMKDLNHKERSKNLQNAFKIQQDMLQYRYILLIDDIYTTGSTIDACAEVLRAGGVEKVYYASLCIGNGF